MLQNKNGLYSVFFAVVLKMEHLKVLWITAYFSFKLTPTCFILHIQVSSSDMMAQLQFPTQIVYIYPTGIFPMLHRLQNSTDEINGSCVSGVFIVEYSSFQVPVELCTAASGFCYTNVRTLCPDFHKKNIKPRFRNSKKL